MPGKHGAPRGGPEKVKVHDFLDPAKGKAIPYGVYDLRRNLGWVSVGVDHDTAAFAVVYRVGLSWAVPARLSRDSVLIWGEMSVR